MIAQGIQPQVNLGGFKAPLASAIGRIAITSTKGSLIGAAVGTALGATLAGTTVLICSNSEMRSEAKPLIYMMGIGASIAYPVVGTGVGLIAGAVTQTTREVFNLCRYLIR